MSGQLTFKTYEEVIQYIANYHNPICFQVNYIPKKDEYELWIGNQPYYNYHEWIEELEQQNKRYREALEFYADSLDHDRVWDSGDVARQALEESK